METLAYLHLALAHEAADTDCKAAILIDPKYFVKLKLSTGVTVQLFALTVALLLFGMANQALAFIQEGDRGTEVTTIQQRLQELGYFQGNITGYFGSLTKQAVIRFQEAKGLIADGIVGTNTEAALEGQPTKANIAPVREDSSPILQIGDRGSQVSALQESLAVAGFSGGNNGVFDAATHEAVKRFQLAKGLTVDGIVGPRTRSALPAIGGPNPAPAKASASEPNIKTLQKRLQARGFYSGSIDGLWGPKTQSAVEAAQRAYDVGAEDLVNGGF